MRTPGVDHLVLATESLEHGVPWLTDRLGAGPAGAGRHHRYGTHNALWNLDDGTYLELIAVDPDAPAPGRPRWFALDRFAGPPRLVHWVLRLATLPPFAAEHGRTLRLSRDELSWSVTVPDDGSLPVDGSGVWPSLIAWDGGHPSSGLAGAGLALSRLVLSTPSAGALRSRLVEAGLTGLLGHRITVTPGPVALRAELTTPGGPVTL
ncbi:VOC family protein [Actinomycetospora sp. NBRC 106378]|uniref:VOC family protein n=1 Tax=Actinomycetospora sp. NBRC 106378 TaxID=3032208 RepID=UPI0024A33821|nr:VOC family protein [Actinomycetospora sp. NBRC 106378]GLZ50419.1 glyoxalase [Actinomycetospora sp. NBRC 106378]